MCLSLSQLQKLASSKFGFTAKKTLEVAQTLYENHKAITYPRTDCGYLPESQFSEARAILENLKNILNNEEYRELFKNCDAAFRSPVWNDKKITAHHGIIPTQNPGVSLSAMSAGEQKIYDLICCYYIAQFMGDYEYARRSVRINCLCEIFKAGSNTPLKAGWKEALKNCQDTESINHKKTKPKKAIETSDSNENNQEESDDHLGMIPLLIVDESVAQGEQKITSHQTKPPLRFTEGSLIDAMKSIGKFINHESYRKTLKETAGIGTEATRANIIETLFKRAYIARQNKHIIATEKGKYLIEKLPDIVCNPVLTAEWEQRLDEVGAGSLKLESFLHQQKTLLDDMLIALKKQATATASYKIPSANNKNDGNNSQDDFEVLPNTYLCKECSHALVRKKNKQKNTFFWGCGHYPNCKFTSSDVDGKPCVHSQSTGS